MSESTSRKVLVIPKRIVGWGIKKDVAAAAAPADIDPRTLRIERREEGTWESITTKIVLPTPNGTKTLYFNIGFGVVCGRIGGKQICIERPLEFFLPASQTSAEQQWVAATFRMLSLAARGGFVARALHELRQVNDQGGIWFGKTKSGKTLCHPSEVAALAWAMQNELGKRGFLDDDGNDRSLEDLAARYVRMKAGREDLHVDNPHVELPPPPEPAKSHTAAGQPIVGRCPDPNCQGDMVSKDNCPTCVDCGYSKCG